MGFPFAAIPEMVKGVKGLAVAGIGIHQANKARRQLRNLKRPTYETPKEVLAAQRQALNRAQVGLSEAEKQFAVQNTQRAAQDVLSASGDRRGGLAALAGITGMQNNAYMNLMAQDYAARRNAEQSAIAQQNLVGQYRDKEFNTNQMQPYRLKYNEAQALLGAGMRNITGGLMANTNAGMAAAMNSGANTGGGDGNVPLSQNYNAGAMGIGSGGTGYNPALGQSGQLNTTGGWNYQMGQNQGLDGGFSSGGFNNANLSYNSVPFTNPNFGGGINYYPTPNQGLAGGFSSGGFK